MSQPSDYYGKNYKLRKPAKYQKKKDYRPKIDGENPSKKQIRTQKTEKSITLAPEIPHITQAGLNLYSPKLNAVTNSNQAAADQTIFHTDLNMMNMKYCKDGQDFYKATEAEMRGLIDRSPQLKLIQLQGNQRRLMNNYSLLDRISTTHMPNKKDIIHSQQKFNHLNQPIDKARFNKDLENQRKTQISLKSLEQRKNVINQQKMAQNEWLQDDINKPLIKVQERINFKNLMKRKAQIKGQFWIEDYQQFDIDALIPLITPATLNFLSNDSSPQNGLITIDNGPLKQMKRFIQQSAQNVFSQLDENISSMSQLLQLQQDRRNQFYDHQEPNIKTIPKFKRGNYKSIENNVNSLANPPNDQSNNFGYDPKEKLQDKIRNFQQEKNKEFIKKQLLAKKCFQQSKMSRERMDRQKELLKKALMEQQIQYPKSISYNLATLQPFVTKTVILDFQTL